MASVFISHSSEDKPWLWGIVHKLRLLGHNIFIDTPEKVRLPDQCGIEIGERWFDRLSTELRSVDVVLAIWSKSASERMKRGKGQAFAREIFWAACEDRLAFALIDQPRLPSRASDEVFLESTVPPDLQPLYAMLKSDRVYGEQYDRVQTLLADGQHFRIEGARRRSQRLEGDVGLMKLHRERLSADRRASPRRLIDYDALNATLSTIDRKPQVEQLLGAIDRSRDEPGRPVALISGSECEPHFVMKRIDATEREVDWRRHYAPQREARIADFQRRVQAVLAEFRAATAATVSRRPLLVHTVLTIGTAEFPGPSEANDTLLEWREAVEGIERSRNEPILFCVTLKDETAIDLRHDPIEVADIATIALGRVPLADVRAWCESGHLGEYLRQHGLAFAQDSEGYDVPASEWIRDRVLAELDHAGETMPTMRRAVRLASRSVQAAFDSRINVPKARGNFLSDLTDSASRKS